MAHSLRNYELLWQFRVDMSHFLRFRRSCLSWFQLPQWGNPHMAIPLEVPIYLAWALIKCDHEFNCSYNDGLYCCDGAFFLHKNLSIFYQENITKWGAMRFPNGDKASGWAWTGDQQSNGGYSWARWGYAQYFCRACFTSLFFRMGHTKMW